MRIAVVVTGGFHPSGREQVVPSWLSLFGRLATQHEIHVFAMRHLPQAQTYQLNGITVHDLGRPSAQFGFAFRAQERALAQAMTGIGSFELVHGFWADPAGLLATRMARRFSIPGIVTCDSGEFVAIDDLEYGSQCSARGRARVREAVTGATRVHVCTSAMAKQVMNYGVTPVVVPLGVEMVGNPTAREEGPPWRLLQVGSLSGVKNQALLIDALEILNRPDIELDLVGQDTLGGELQRKAGERPQIRFHGFVAHDALTPLRARAHLYVQTSRHESAGVAVLEAAAAGVPVLGTRVGYIADWAGAAARAIDDVTPESLAAEIVSLLQDAAARSQFALEAGHFARRLNADYTASEFDRIYRETAKRRSSTAG